MSAILIPEQRLAETGAGPLRRCGLMPTAGGGSLADLVRLMGGEADGTPVPGEVTVPLWRVRAGATLFHEGAHSEHLYVVRSGTFKCFTMLEDGYEQVLGFAGPAEVLGFEAQCRGRQSLSAVALEESSVHALPLQELERWRHRCPALDRALMRTLSRQFAHAAAMVEMMAAVAAEVRLARFLVWLSSRMAELGHSPRRLLLRMSRRDIGSLLGVAHETVSRSFGTLADWGYLRVRNREVEILDLPGLKACTHCTRGLGDEIPRTAARRRLAA